MVEERERRHHRTRTPKTNCESRQGFQHRDARAEPTSSRRAAIPPGSNQCVRRTTGGVAPLKCPAMRCHPFGMNAGRSDRRSQRTQRGLTTTTKREQLLTRVARAAAAAALEPSRTLCPSVHLSRRDNRILNHGSVMPEPYPLSSPSAPLQTAGCTQAERCRVPFFARLRLCVRRLRIIVLAFSPGRH